MDISLNSASFDRAPAKPQRTTPRIPLLFTRSRVFRSFYKPKVSIRRSKTIAVRRTNLTFWILFVAAAVALFLFLSWTYLSDTLMPKEGTHGFGLTSVQRRHSRVASTAKTTSANESVKGLLDVVLSAEQNETPVLPSYLTIHKLLSSTGRMGSTRDEDVASCIVTAYFRVKSKYDSTKYEDDWMGNMLSLQDCMVIFCEPDLVDTMLRHRGDRIPTAVVSLRLEDLPIASYYRSSSDFNTPLKFWEHQFDIDPEKRRHRSYELFWVWLSKSWFVSTAAVLQHELFDTAHRIEFWMWADIGSFRNEKYKDQRLIQHSDSILRPDDTLTVVWMAHHAPDPPKDPFWNKKLNKSEKHHFYHSGSHAAASTVQAWINFHTLFVDTLDRYAAKGLFVGEDQCVLQTTCLLHPEACAYVPFDQVSDNHYFGLRHVLFNGPVEGKSFQLWRPPAI
jgi:hypothetical protein